MGSGAFPVLGRLKRPVNQPLQFTDEQAVITEGLTPDQFEFCEVHNDLPIGDACPSINLERNYPLFGWLYNLRGSTHPHVNMYLHYALSVEFIHWLSTGQPTYLDPPERDGGTEFQDRYGEGFYGPLLLPIDWLLAFDYDQVAVMSDYSQEWSWAEDVDGRENQFFKMPVPHCEGATYRQLFSNDDEVTYNYFEFLHTVKEHDWDFIVFYFD